MQYNKRIFKCKGGIESSGNFKVIKPGIAVANVQQIRQAMVSFTGRYTDEESLYQYLHKILKGTSGFE